MFTRHKDKGCALPNGAIVTIITDKCEFYCGAAVTFDWEHLNYEGYSVYAWTLGAFTCHGIKTVH